MPPGSPRSLLPRPSLRNRSVFILDPRLRWFEFWWRHEETSSITVLNLVTLLILRRSFQTGWRIFSSFSNWYRSKVEKTGFYKSSPILILSHAVTRAWKRTKRTTTGLTGNFWKRSQSRPRALLRMYWGREWKRSSLSSICAEELWVEIVLKPETVTSSPGTPRQNAMRMSTKFNIRSAFYFRSSI